MGFSVENPPKVEGKKHGASQQIPSCSINQNRHPEHNKENTFGAK
jgi:hypothetical protein